MLFAVDLRPVVVLRGAVPMFRDLSSGAKGADVEQLQQALERLGQFSGNADGSFGASTTRAVRSWQNSLGITVDGVVRATDVEFVEDLPASLALGDDLTVGSRLSPGEQVLWRLSSAPDFELAVPVGQAELVDVGRLVEIAHDAGAWQARVASTTRTPDGQQLIGKLVPRTDEDAVCGADCFEMVPLEGRSSYRAQIVVVEPTRGPVVPLAALTTTPDGETAAMRIIGEEVPVKIVAAADGLAVIDGLAPGDQVFVPYPTTPPPSGAKR